MTDNNRTLIILALISAMPGVLSSIMGVLNNILQRRNEQHMAVVKRDIIDLKENTDGMKDALVRVTGEAEYQKGLKQGTGEGVKMGVEAYISHKQDEK